MNLITNDEDFSSFIVIIVRLLDVVLITAASFSAYALYFKTYHIPTYYFTAILLSTIYIMIIFPSVGIYSSARGKGPTFWIQKLSYGWFLVLLSLMTTSVLLKVNTSYSRVWFILWGILGWVYLLSLRKAIAIVLSFLRKKGWNKKRIIIFGAGDLGAKVEKQLRHITEVGFEIMAFFDDDPSKANKQINNINVYGPEVDLYDYIIHHSIHELWLTLPLRAENRLKEIIFNLRHSTILVRFVPDVFSFGLFNHSNSNIAGIPVLDLNKSPMVGVNRIVKAIEDRILAFIILLLISPLMLLIAVAIKMTSKGPVFFKQIRHGWDGKPIKIYKFRSMNLHTEKEGEITQATKNDPRLTRIGAFLRKTSLDELPQFFNVLQGRMSIVGPRPHAIQHNNEFKDQIYLYMQRHKVKPGITGWAQINGWRGETDTLYKMEKRVEHDLYYIENWSLLFDLKIIAATIFKGFINKNAY